MAYTLFFIFLIYNWLIPILGAQKKKRCFNVIHTKLRKVESTLPIISSKNKKSSNNLTNCTLFLPLFGCGRKCRQTTWQPE